MAREDNFLNTIADKEEQILALRDQLKELEQKYWMERNSGKDYFVSLIAAKQDLKSLAKKLEDQTKLTEIWKSKYESLWIVRLKKASLKLISYLKKNTKA